MIYGKDAREDYNKGIIDDFLCIRSKLNFADAMTKDAFLTEFVEALDKN